jgi:hypothetical protein
MGLFDNMYGFNPNTIQTPTYPQARITTTPNPPLINPISSPTELPMVNGYESAMRYPMQPNSRIALFDANDDIMYIKQTDASGYPVITRYRFTRVEENPQNDVQYVTLDEFNKFKEELLNGQQPVRKSESTKSTAKRNGESKANDANV